MKFKLLFGVLIISLFLISGCSDIDLSKLSDEDLERVSEKLIMCGDYYMRHEAGCCLDKNENKICDEDEKKDKEVELIPERCVISTGSGLFCDDFSIDSANAVRLNIHNILNEDVTGVTITLVNPAGGSCSNAAAVPIAADATAVVTMDCTADPLVEEVKADLAIAYTVGGFARTTTGSLSSKVP